MTPESRFRLLLDLTLTIAEATTSEEAFESVLRSCCAVGGWSVGQVWIPDEDAGFLECSGVWHQASPGHEAFHEASRSSRLSPGTSWLGDALLVPQVRRVELERMPDHLLRSESATAAGLRTGLVVPVTAGGRTAAVLEFLSPEDDAADVAAEDLLTAVAAQLGASMARRAVESDLRRSEALFRAVAETAHDAIITIDTHGDIVYANPECRRMFGHEQGLVGSPVTSIIPERLRQTHRSGLARYLETGRPHIIGSTVVVPALRRDGSEFPAELSLAALEVDGSQSFTAIIRDVSERERVLEELERSLSLEREAATRLIELDHLKDTFMDTVSHDLRSPLATIRAVTGFLKRDAHTPTLSPDQLRAHLDALDASAEKMRRLLDDLLSMERVTAGPVALQRQDTDVGQLARDVVREHADALARHRIELHLAPVRAEVDVLKVQRIVENLLLNAARHTPAGTAVTVTVTASDDAAFIRVEDEGPGIPEELREKVFEKFYRVPGQRAPGTGVGLSLVARLAALHGGRAWVDGGPTGGARFTVELPRTAPEAADD